MGTLSVGRLAALLLVLLCTACTTLQSQKGEPEQLRARIQQGALVQVGDQVAIVTLDGQLHRFSVTEITTDQIIGADDRVELAALQSLEVQRPTLFSYLVGGTLVAVALNALVVAVVAIFVW